MTGRDRLLALLVPVLWGLNFVVLDEGLEGVPPLLFLALRFTFVAFPLILFVPRPQVHWTTMLLVGTTMSLGQFSLLYLSLAAGLPAGLASLVLQVQVIFSIVLAWLVLGERTTSVQRAGIALGAAGLLVVAVAHGSRAPVLPLLLAVGAAASWAVGNIVTRHARVASGLSLVVWSALAVPLPSLALSLLVDGPDEIATALGGLGPTAIASTAYSVVFASLVGYSLYSGLLSRYTATAVVPYALLVPPVGIASAWLLQGEAPTAAEGVGAVVMMAGVWIATVGAARRAGRIADAAPRAAETAALGAGDPAGAPVSGPAPARG